MNYQLSKASICDIGLSIIDNLESMHKAGYIYNDLKLDNLMVGFGQKISKTHNNVFEDCIINLIDYGYTTRYLDHAGNHIEQGELDNFRGNIVCASLSHMESWTTSRKDDLISLCYLLIYLLNRGKLLGIERVTNLGHTELFRSTI
jgi:serine/threonine protein kinase